MAETKSARFSKEQVTAIEDMVEQGKADNQSEAHRMFVNAGMREYGYVGGALKETKLRWAVRETSKLCLYAGVVLLGLTWLYPVIFRLAPVGPIVAGLVLHGADRALGSVEPDVSNWLRGLVGGTA
jgi:Arc/MetJ-type ribon-helix-helix transcriptional regulator